MTRTQLEAQPAVPNRGASHAGAAGLEAQPQRAPFVLRARPIAGVLLLLVVAGAAFGLMAWKRQARADAAAASTGLPEPAEAILAATAREHDFVRTVGSVGTVQAIHWVTLANELPGRVQQSALVPGAVVEAGTLLVAFDVSVEQAELAALEAQAKLADTLLERMQKALENRGASEVDVDRARAERDVARAQVTRTAAIIERKTLRAPFRSRVGLSDVHVGQYLEAGTVLTTLQGLDEHLHVDFSVPQDVAAGLRTGQEVEVRSGAKTLPATIVAVDAHVDVATRNTTVRAQIPAGADAPAPGSAVRVRVPVGGSSKTVAVPVSALRRGPGGDHVYVLAPDAQGQLRASERRVVTRSVLANEVLIASGLEAGEQVATSGSFKLREGALVAVAQPTQPIDG